MCNMYVICIHRYKCILLTSEGSSYTLLSPQPISACRKIQNHGVARAGFVFFSLAKSAAKCRDLRVLVPIHSLKLTASLPLKNGGWETTGRIDTFREGRKICFPLISCREPFPVFRRNGADGVFCCFLLISMTIPILPKKTAFHSHR